MDRVAVFVDAGYLFAQGSAALLGSKCPREHLTLDAAALVDRLRDFATTRSGIPLLRIYWYDGARGSTLAPDHARLADTPDVKLRLGVLNTAGQQKGVDAMIVTDLIELARNHAIADAVLLSGDEDVRIGVQIAQSYGIRVHLLGIAPARGSQSAFLMREADTTDEWDAAMVATFLSARSDRMLSATPDPATHTGVISGSSPLAQAIEAFWRDLDEPSRAVIRSQIASGTGGLPGEVDRRLLPHCRDAIRRELDTEEKRFARRRLRDLADS
jgi:uncharacterized LabA/DUF88 family protein